MVIIKKNKKVQENFRKELLEKFPDKTLLKLSEQIHKNY
jgi:hypothetical protein